MSDALSREILRAYPSAIADLPSGRVDLGVPLLHGVVQIEAVGPVEPGRILVVTDEEQVTTISRTNGDPLQAELVEGGGPAAARTRTKALEAPVPWLRILPRTTGDGRQLWYAEAEGLRIHDQAAMGAFTDKIGSCAMEKIMKTAHGTVRIGPDGEPADS